MFQWERDFLILTDVVQDSFKIDGRMWDERRKITGRRRYVENCDSNQAGSG